MFQNFLQVMRKVVMNKLELDLSNFQSISSGHLEFETGLNFIIGQSNSGKSATFRALKACLSNPIGSQRFIKNGEKQAQVTLSYNGNTISWKRTSKESSYEINGEKFVKTGKSDAFKLLDSTGFVQDHNEIIMNIEEELQLPFPFGFSKSDLFKLFENIFCVSDSAIILKSMKDHEVQIKTEIDFLENDLLKNKKKVEELQKFKEDIDLSKLCEIRELLSSQQLTLKKLQDGQDIIKKAVLADSFTLPQSLIIKDQLTSYRNLQNIKDTVVQVKAAFSLLKSLSNLPAPRKLSVIELRDLKKIQVVIKQITELDQLNEIKGFTELTPIDIGKYNQFKALQCELGKLKSLESLDLPTIEIRDLVTQYTYLRNYKEALKEVLKKIKVQNERKKSLDDKIKDLKTKLSQYKICPLCHQPIGNCKGEE